jgi:predicted MPP superfamily phosphohydrolase
LRVLELPVAGLPPELDGLRIAHLSDFHLGPPSRGTHAVERAVEWVEARQPDLVCLTGDLVTRPRGRRRFDQLVARLPHLYVVHGNHDGAMTPLRHGTLLSDSSEEVELRGRRVELAGVDPRSWLDRRPSGFPPSGADLRILLCHFPTVLDRVEPGRWQLILAGHLHAGQIVLPYGFGRLLLAHPGAPYPQGVFVRGTTTLHVSPGLGTTFVPFRYFARPEATEIVLRSSS